MTDDDDTLRGAQLAAQSKLYDQVLDSGITERAVDFLARANLLTEITDDIDTARDYIHTPEGSQAARREWDDMDDERRKQMTNVVGQHWSLNVNLAVRRLWHAAQVLGYKPDTIDPKHVALVAATYLSRSPDDVIDELDGIINGD